MSLFRKEEEKEFYGTTYKLKQLTGTIGARILMRLLKIFSSGANSLGELLQQPAVIQMLSMYMATNLVINDSVMDDLPSNIKTKLHDLKGQEFTDTGGLEAVLADVLEEQEYIVYSQTIIEKAAGDSAPDLSTIVGLSGQLLKLLNEIIHNIDADEFDGLLNDIINRSVIRYRLEGSEKFQPWKNVNNDYAFDEFFAGNYHAMLELFAYLVLFNYGESLIMLKKNQILEWTAPFLDKLKKQPVTDS